LVLPSLRARHSVPFVGTVPAIKPAARALGDAPRRGFGHAWYRQTRLYPGVDPHLRG
jgi:hypothetical protein